MEAPAPFPDAAGAQAWRRAVDRVLKGAAFDEVMVSATDDGIAIQPLYPKAEHPLPQPVRRAGPVRVVQRMDHPDPALANALALAELDGGAGGLAIVLDGAAGARGFGLPPAALAEDTLLARINPGAIALRLDAPPSGAGAAAAMLARWVERAGYGPEAVAVDFGLGVADATTALALRRQGFAAPLLRADGRPFHEAGASEAEELASLLAMGVAMLRALDARGAAPDELADAISVVAVADTDMLLTIAKLRALRRLWACVERACGLDPHPLALHAETAWRAMTRRAPWTNLLRGGVAAAGAILGGADSLTVLPFTTPLGLPDAFARRLARNAAFVLLDEAHLGRLSDPAGGTGAIEALTEALCDTAWTAFQAIEAAGGFPAALESGFWPARIAESRARRQGEVGAGTRAILGVSLFPHADDALPPVLMDARRGSGEDGTLPSMRDADALELAGVDLGARP